MSGALVPFMQQPPAQPMPPPFQQQQQDPYNMMLAFMSGMQPGGKVGKAGQKRIVPYVGPKRCPYWVSVGQ
jgi:hypothetical protein